MPLLVAYGDGFKPGGKGLELDTIYRLLQTAPCPRVGLAPRGLKKKTTVSRKANDGVAV
jgi:hypothetical protein